MKVMMIPMKLADVLQDEGYINERGYFESEVFGEACDFLTRYCGLRIISHTPHLWKIAVDEESPMYPWFMLKWS
jgi:hypothetical protein